MVQAESGQAIPDEGDVLLLDFGPVKGHEQDGLRFGIVLSPKALNRSGICLIVPMTTRISGAATEIPITSFDNGKTGVAICTQVTAVDWGAREAQFKGRVDKAELYRVRYTCRLLLGALPTGYRPA